MVESIKVRTVQKYVSLKDYYVRNWLSCKLMWVRCYRKGLPLLGDNTTNRIENKFGRLKLDIKDTFMSLPKTGVAIIHLVQYAEKLLTERYGQFPSKGILTPPPPPPLQNGTKLLMYSCIDIHCCTHCIVVHASPWKAKVYNEV